MSTFSPQQAPPSKLQPALLFSSSQNPSFLTSGFPHLPGAAVVGAAVDGDGVDGAGVDGAGVDGAGVDGAGVDGDGVVVGS